MSVLFVDQGPSTAWQHGAQRRSEHMALRIPGASYNIKIRTPSMRLAPTEMGHPPLAAGENGEYSRETPLGETFSSGSDNRSVHGEVKAAFDASIFRAAFSAGFKEPSKPLQPNDLDDHQSDGLHCRSVVCRRLSPSAYSSSHLIVAR